jgi:Cu/Ag efflux pump CusA
MAQMLVIPANPLNNQELTQEQHCRLAKVFSVQEVDNDLHLVVVRIQVEQWQEVDLQVEQWQEAEVDLQVEQWQEAEVDLQVVECLTLSMVRCLEIFLDKQMQALVQEWGLRHME